MYVVQSDFEKDSGEYLSEMSVPINSNTAELEAWNAYIGALDTAVNKRLRKRPATEKYFSELAEKIKSDISENKEAT
jgi:hypothetical protein